MQKSDGIQVKSTEIWKMCTVQVIIGVRMVNKELLITINTIGNIFELFRAENRICIDNFTCRV